MATQVLRCEVGIEELCVWSHTADVEQHLVEVVARADTLVHILQQHM